MAIPTLVQHISTGREVNASKSSGSTDLILNFPNPSLAGNLLVVGVESDSGLTIHTPTDNKGNTWVAGPSIGTGGQTVCCFYTLNAAAGTISITVNYTGVDGTPACSGVASEFYNVQLSGAIGPTGSVNSTSPVNITLSSAPTLGDLVWTWGTDISALLPVVSGISAGTNFNLLSANRSVGLTSQYSVTTSSSTAGYTVTSGGDSFNAVALTFHAASAGTAPSIGIRVQKMMIEFLGNLETVIQTPTTGNLLVGVWTDSAASIATVSDTHSNLWNTSLLQNTGGDVAQIIYAVNATTDLAMTASFTFTGSPSSFGAMIRIFDVVGADTAPFDTSAITSGNQTTNGTLTSGSVTPSQLNSLVINLTGIDWHTITGTVVDSNGHLPNFTQPVWTGNDNAPTGTSPSQLADDDGVSIFYDTSDTTQITFIYPNTTGTLPPTGVELWGSICVVFKAPATGPLGIQFVGQVHAG